MPDWREKLCSAVQRDGYSSLSDFASAHPRWTLDAIADHLDANVIQVQSVLIDEGQGDPVRTALDLLSRRLRRHLDEGWNVGEKARWRAILAISGWESSAKKLGVRDTSRVLEVFEAAAQDGWLPEGPDDPLLRASIGELSG